MSGNDESVPWWRRRREELLALARESAPCYVYDLVSLRRTGRRFLGLDAVTRSFFAVKANPHPAVLRALGAEGYGFECVSPGEMDRVFDVLPDLNPERVLFQPNFAAVDEYADAIERGVRVTLDNVQPLARHPRLFDGQDLFVRIDPGEGDGHHRKVRTAGARSKFGIAPDDLPELQRAADRASATVVGLHAHLGSGITDEQTWGNLVDTLASLARRIPSVRALNVGGGLGVAAGSRADSFHLDAVDEALAAAARRHDEYTLWMEPGRYLVAEAGVLLAQVTQTKTKDDVRFVGLETGMNSLLRPALYDARHEIVNLTRLDEPASQTVDVVGPICETGDVIGRDRELPTTEPGDVILVATVGAYGASMANRYNLREPAEEIVLAEGGT